MALTLATLPPFLEGIDMTCLPQTLRDAIEVTRGLNIRYLWIDALCIVQDDDSDKANEIQQMGEIYKNSTVTIVAARSRAVREGFLHQQFQPFAAVEGQFRQNNKLEKVWLVPETTPELGRDPLSLRGWTFQEQLLSPRLLQYGPKAVTWHCASVTALPIHPRYSIYKYRMPSGYVIEELRARALTNKEGSPRMLSDTSSEDSPWYELMARQWPRLVEQYCGRDLSFATDKLLAISGVAKEVYNTHSDIYLAGLWKSAIIRHLAWRRDDKHDHAGHVTPSDSCDVPTWSWASMSCPILYKPLATCDACFVKTAVQPKLPSSPFGDVKGKSLVLSAKIVKLEKAGFFAEYLSKVTLDKPSDMRNSNNQESNDIWYMLLGALYTYSSTFDKEPTGLILAKSHGTFKRVGLFEGKKEMENFFSKIERTDVEIV